MISGKSARRFIISLLGLLFWLPLTQSATAQGNISRIQAGYDIHLSGFYLGRFQFLSDFKGSRYTMTGQTTIEPPLVSMFFKWQGRVRSAGTVRGVTPVPKSYDFSFKSNKKSGKLKMTFIGGAVAKVVQRPYYRPSRRAIPVKPSQLAGVMDPMSALMLLRRKGRSLRTACQGKIPVFDGKQRFDLKLSYKGTRRLTREDTGGYVGQTVICRVKYQPISGYKPTNKATKYISASKGIEIWLIPIPRSRIAVPYRITLPTPAGTATVKSKYFKIRHRNGRRASLIAM